MGGEGGMALVGDLLQAGSTIQGWKGVRGKGGNGGMEEWRNGGMEE